MTAPNAESALGPVRPRAGSGTGLSTPARILDLLGVVLLLAVQVVVALLGALVSVLQGLNRTYCSTRPDDGYTPCGPEGYIDAGVAIALGSGAVITLAALAVVIVRAAQGRLTWWIAALAIPSQLACAVLAVVIAAQSGPL